MAYDLFFSENALNPLAFKSLMRLEHEVVRMAADLLHGGHETVGIMTSGGTESCLLAVKAYRDQARAGRRWVRKPQMIVGDTVHVAWEKGAEYFDVKPVHVPVDSSFRLDPDEVRKRINRNTILIVVSAPDYPHGMIDPIDPIEEIGAIAAARGIPLHVDSCLGGFLLPFVEELGYPVPAFDFRVPGVTSLSADLHKYGYAAKGASVILYRSMRYLQHQFFAYENWPGGVFISPGLLGTRPGGAIAAAWAAMMAMGRSGYRERARVVMETTRRLLDGVNAIPGLEVIGRPPMSVFAYRSRAAGGAARPDIFAIGDRLEARGWHIDRLQKPEVLHAMVTPRHQATAARYLVDLRQAVAEVQAYPGLARQGDAAMYGMIARIPLRGLVRREVMKMMKELYGPAGKLPGETVG
jgi:glutamate/tyrosine decarboxylase-like PLP-dependent enzyme